MLLFMAGFMRKVINNSNNNRNSNNNAITIITGQSAGFKLFFHDVTYKISIVRYQYNKS